MPAPARPLPTIVEDVAGEALALASRLHDAHPLQWEAPQLGSYRSTDPALDGLSKDPTGHTAVDPRRLALRVAVVAAELRLEESVSAMKAARAELDEALRRWQGEPTLAREAA
ncbi:hypothetical protein J7E25_11845 [Agromyces sp. ISL-38]|uniref:DUF7169 domain-containing protein n=1 Tax=Agromyces sp. ISL-38 TaxID=2819107 RepID=UPI001BE9770A|nr:hypothetical protein [Agromyces sp. ISL-38]MBT2499787.1 hypothetical protein [Agromyces sp. ISL-38]